METITSVTALVDRSTSDRVAREPIGALVVLVMIDIIARALLRTVSKYVVDPTIRYRDGKLIVSFGHVLAALSLTTIFSEEVYRL